jgi:hypothetical protein
MNDSHRRCGLGQRWLRRTAALATVTCMAVLAAACGGGPAPAASATWSTREQAALAYARCMRSHGVPDFPDPDSNGNFHLSNNQQGGGSRGSASNSDSGQESNAVSSQETAANQVCNHLLDVGPQMNAAQQQHTLGQLVKYAQCMRARGVPNFPDPHTTSGGIGAPSGIGFDLSGIDMHSPQYQAASHACQSLAAHAKG